MTPNKKYSDLLAVVYRRLGKNGGRGDMGGMPSLWAFGTPMACF